MPSTDSLLDLGNFPELYADGLGDVYEVDANLHMLWFRWRLIDGVMRRCLAGEVIQPIASVTPAVLAAWRGRFPHQCAGAVH